MWYEFTTLLMDKRNTSYKVWQYSIPEKNVLRSTRKPSGISPHCHLRLARESALLPKQSSSFSLWHWWLCCCFTVHKSINYSLRIFAFVLIFCFVSLHFHILPTGTYSSEMDISLLLMGRDMVKSLKWITIKMWQEQEKIRCDIFHHCSFSLLLESNYFFHNHVVRYFQYYFF